MIVRGDERDDLTIDSSLRQRGRYLFELGTAKLTEDSFEIAFVIENAGGDGETQEIVLPDRLVVLEQDRYRALLADEAEEPFLTSRSLDHQALVALISEMVQERLAPLAIEHDLPRELEPRGRYGRTGREPGWGRRERGPSHARPPMPPQLESVVTWSEDGPSAWPAAPVRFAAERLLEIVEELAIAGIGRLRFEVADREARLKLSVTGMTLTPPPLGLVETLTHPDLGDLATLAWIAPGLQVEHQLSAERTQFALRILLEQAAFGTGN
jgi:hypothetical protein